MKTLRCAIYTRKSSEEGLEQSFNSLHAQRESCEAYVLSQAGEGWTALATAYDDGGFSGGSMERPGLQALLGAIRRGEVDVVVVYKVDRLTRSLADFARMVELFDTHQVSFVSVTQAFNTTTSMGRLTLNVLLSFAQFERDVTGERIRDQLAASQAKGLWMGGRPPLGYDGVERKLVVNPAEAETVRYIFGRYLELGSVVMLHPDLERRGVRSKRWITKAGKTVGGAVLSRGALYLLLSNPVYRGAIRHRDKLYPDCHPAIIDRAVWDAVQQRLAGNCADHATTPRIGADCPLAGRVFDDCGNPMGAVHVARRARRYRYYASAALKIGSPGRPGTLPRIAAGILESFVAARVTPLLTRSWRPDLPDEQRLAEAIVRVQVGADRIAVSLGAGSFKMDADLHINYRPADQGHEVMFDVRLKHRHGALILEGPGGAPAAPKVDRALVRGLSLARAWALRLARGEMASLRDIAKTEGLCNHYVARLAPLAFLAPDLAEQILEGRQPRAVSLGALIKRPLPMDWSEQRILFDTIGSHAAA
jgi:site-specific DNA recombinase